MRKEDAIAIVKKIIEKCGLDNVISVSGEEYRIADFHVVDTYYLGLRGRKLFEFDKIKRISYVDGEHEREYRYSESFFQIRFEVENEYILYCEYGNYGDKCWIVPHNSNSMLEMGTEEFDRFITDYDIEHSVKDEIVYNLMWLEVYRDDLDLRSAKIWKDEAMKYIKQCDNEKNREDVFFAMVCAALNYHDEEQDVFSLEDMVKKLAEDGKVYSFIWHFRVVYDDIMDEEDLKEYINIILEMKQNIELQAAHLEG